MLGALWLYSLLGGSGPKNGSAFLSEPSSPSGAPLKAALPEELSFNADGGIVLVRRDGTRRALAPAVMGRLPHGWLRRFYSGLEWSPDGSKLLALRWESGKGLVAVSADGQIGPTIARHALDGRFSPDGTRIVFVRRGAGRVLFVASRYRRRAIRLATHVGAISWSPDGTEIAYAGEGTSGLFIADASGRRAPRPVVIPAAAGAAVQVENVEWSPDGSLIAFTSADDSTNVIRPDGTSLRKVADGSEQIAWSPDGKQLALVGADISVVDADGTGFRAIARCSCSLRGGSGTSVAWSLDGSRIAYISGRGNTVSTIRPDGSSATVVVTHAARSLGLLPGAPLWRPTSPR